MAKLVKFSKRRKRPPSTWRRRSYRTFLFRFRRLIPYLVIIAIIGLWQGTDKARNWNEKASITSTPDAPSGMDTLRCQNPYIIDGDTFSCNNKRIRLAGIDAPEMPGHCKEGRRCTEGDPYAAKDFLHSLSRGLVICHAVDIDGYGRLVARCEANDRDLSCAMVESSHAIRRYGSINCSD